jgi:hypothetical protein
VAAKRVPLSLIGFFNVKMENFFVRGPNGFQSLPDEVSKKIKMFWRNNINLRFFMPDNSMKFLIAINVYYIDVPGNLQILGSEESEERSSHLQEVEQSNWQRTAYEYCSGWQPTCESWVCAESITDKEGEGFEDSETCDDQCSNSTEETW